MSEHAPRFAAVLALIYDDCIARARAQRAAVQSTQTPTQEKPTDERRRPA